MYYIKHIHILNSHGEIRIWRTLEMPCNFYTNRFSRKPLFKLGFFSLGFEIWPVAGVVVVSAYWVLLPKEVVLKDGILL